MMLKAFFLTSLALVHGSPVQKVKTPVQKAVSPVLTQVTPVQKVIALLEGMLEKGKKQKFDEQAQFAEFKEFCNGVISAKTHAIDDETENIEYFTADVRKERATAKLMTHDMARLDKDMSNWSGDIKAATNVRKIEQNDYDALHDDYSESVDALMQAIATLKAQGKTGDRKQQSGLVQVSALKSLNLIPASAKKVIDVFLQQGEDASLEGASSVNAPEANAYEFHSAGVIEMLEKLLDKFLEERRTIEKAETTSKRAYQMLVQDLKALIAAASERRGGKSVTKASALEEKAEDKSDRSDERSLKGSDTKYRSDLQSTCAQKTAAFESRQQLRANEIIALEKAIEILSSDAVAGNSIKHLPAMLQTKGSSFSQLRSSSTHWNRVATYLQEQALKLDSRVLAVIAEKAAADPFIKVKKMLGDLLLRLMEAANEEAEHKGWCDTELAKNEQTRKKKTAAVETLHAEIDQLQASIAKLTEEISVATKADAELDAAMASQTKLRFEEKAKNTETIKDAGDAQVATERAIAVLREFYVEAGEAIAFVQTRAGPETPEVFDSSYKGMGAESGGVLGMLEVIETDFARLETATKAAEASAQKEYDEFMIDSHADGEKNTAQIRHKSAKKLDNMKSLTFKKGDLDGTQRELEASLSYFDKLKPSCVDAGVVYEDRVAHRNEEIAALREALKILGGEDIP